MLRRWTERPRYSGLGYLPDDFVEPRLDATYGRGVDVAFDVVGDATMGEVVDWWFAWIDEGGRAVTRPVPLVV